MNEHLLKYIICGTHIGDDSWITYTKFNTDRWNKFIEAYNARLPFWNGTAIDDDKESPSYGTKYEWEEFSNHHIITQSLIDTCRMFTVNGYGLANKADITIREIIKAWNKNEMDEEGYSYRQFIEENY